MGYSMNILLVDDDRLSLAMLTEALRMSGYKSNGFTKPEEALKEFQNSRYDIVVADYQMPGMNGIELMKKMLSLKPSTTIFLTSGILFEDLKSLALAAGAYGFLQKPLDVFEVISKLSSIEKENLQNLTA